MNNNYIITLGAITFEGRTGIPTMEILVKEKDTDRIVDTKYLAPFRGYAFQVSGTRNGEWDCGSSSPMAYNDGNKIHGYGTILKDLTQYNNYAVLNPILKGQAMIALVEFASREFIIRDKNSEDGLTEIHPALGFRAGNNAQLDRFIGESIKWIGLGDNIKENCEYGRSSDDGNKDVNVVYKKAEEAC